MTHLKIYFTDFSSDFNIANDIFYLWLSKHFSLELDPINPDYLIYSCYGYDYLNFSDAVRIFYTAENIRPDFNLCDYAIGFDYIQFDDRYLRFPSFARYGKQFDELLKEKSFSKDILSMKLGFCNFIYTNGNADPARDHFFKMLDQKKRVDSLGAHLCNTTNGLNNRFADNWRESKVDLQKQYKFSIAFENSSSKGYTTEKLLHAFIANTIPIYWGNPVVDNDFNPEAFINCHNYNTWEDVIDKIIEIDNDDEQYLYMLNQPPFRNNQKPRVLSHSVFLEFFDNIFNQPKEKAFRRPRYGATKNYEFRFKKLIEIKQRFDLINRIISKFKRIWSRG